MSKQPFLIKTPYNVKNAQQAQKILAPKVLQAMKNSSNNQSIQLDKQAIVFLTKRPLQKPIYQVKCTKYRHKQTGQQIELINQSKMITTLFDYTRMGDFQYPKKNQVKRHHLIQKLQKIVFEKGHFNLQKKVGGKQIEQNYQIDKLQLQLPPFLRQYNLAPPNRDLLINKRDRGVNLTNLSQTISYGQPIPMKPLTQVPEFIKKSPIYNKISQYLEKRPCWLRNVFLTQLKQDGLQIPKQTELKNALRYLCYTFRNGPWKSTYCAFGFNPLRVSKAVIYQHISVKLKKKEAQDYEEQVNQQLYDPTMREISKRCVRGYQLCDISDQKIREILNGRLVIEDEEGCSKQHGWLNKSQYMNIVSIIKKRLNSIQ